MHPATDRRRALRHAEALEGYLCLLRDAPDDWSIAHTAADLLQLADRHDEAVTIYLGMARYWMRAGEVGRASEIYERVLTIAPANRTALVRLAELAMGRGEEDEARSLLSPLAYLQAGRVEDARSALVRTAVRERCVRPELAEALRTGASAGGDDGAALAIALADVCLLPGNAAEGLATLRAFLGEVPHHVGVLRQIIEVAVETGAGREALQAQAELVDAYLERGMPERAVPVAEDLASRYPAPTNTARLSRLRDSAGAEPPAALQDAATSDAPLPPPARVERVRDLSAALDGLERPAGEDDPLKAVADRVHRLGGLHGPR